MPYLELKKDKEGEIEEVETVTMPNIRSMSIKDAKKVLKELNLNFEINGEVDEKEIDTENTYIKEQTPKPGIKINAGSNVFVEI